MTWDSKRSGWTQIRSVVVYRGFILPLFVTMSELHECRLELGLFNKGGERPIRNNIIIILIIIYTPFNNFNNSHTLKRTIQKTLRLLYLSKWKKERHTNKWENKKKGIGHYKVLWNVWFLLVNLQNFVIRFCVCVCLSCQNVQLTEFLYSWCHFSDITPQPLAAHTK